MPIGTHPAHESDPFRLAHERFEELIEWLRRTGVTDHGEQERALKTRGDEVLRLAYQGWLDAASATEKSAAARTPVPEGTRVYTQSREIESGFGRLRLKRLGYKSAGEGARFPLDEQLNLPKAIYTHPLQERVARDSQARAWDGVVKGLAETSAAHVPKRQAEQIAQEVTQDFGPFYAQRAANDELGEDTLLMGSSDAKGVRVLLKALREATRQAAEAEKAAAAVRDDPMAAKKPRSHDRRMAAVAAVWQQEPVRRTADDIVADLQRTPATKAKAKLPRPQNKRVWASVEKNLSTSVGEIFDEFDRRDPDRTKMATVLVDGQEDQQTAIFDHARSHRRSVTIVLDLIHVIHYLWLAGLAICRGDRKKADPWVAEHLRVLLTQPVDELIAAIQRAAATVKCLSRAAKTSLRTALRYFRRNAPFMDYPTFLANGLPIATGVIEGACRHLVQDRLGITGARWDLPGAEAMLKLRALHSSGDWDAYWRFHERQEALRNYPSVQAAA